MLVLPAPSVQACAAAVALRGIGCRVVPGARGSAVCPEQGTAAPRPRAPASTCHICLQPEQPAHVATYRYGRTARVVALSMLHAPLLRVAGRAGEPWVCCAGGPSQGGRRCATGMHCFPPCQPVAMLVQLHVPCHKGWRPKPLGACCRPAAARPLAAFMFLQPQSFGPALQPK